MQRTFDRLRANWAKQSYGLETIRRCAPTRGSHPTCPPCYETGAGARTLTRTSATSPYVCPSCKKSYAI